MCFWEDPVPPVGSTQPPARKPRVLTTGPYGKFLLYNIFEMTVNTRSSALVLPEADEVEQEETGVYEGQPAGFLKAVETASGTER